MIAQIKGVVSDKSAGDRRLSQLKYLCHSLDLFASADPTMRAGASHYTDRLRQDGFNNDEVIKIAATALLIAAEQEIAKTIRLHGKSVFHLGKIAEDL